MNSDESLTEIERLLLMAAAVHGLGPETPLQFANGRKVVGQALLWAGYLDRELREAWERLEEHREIKIFYGALIRMTQQQLRSGEVLPPDRAGTTLFEGAGNLGTPDEPASLPDYTAFRLTAEGAVLAQSLLARRPECVKGRSGVDF